MKVWALWSSRVDPYSAPDLVEVFADEATAERVRAELIGKPHSHGMRWPWEDDEDFPDLYVRPLEVRGLP